MCGFCVRVCQCLRKCLASYCQLAASAAVTVAVHLALCVCVLVAVWPLLSTATWQRTLCVICSSWDPIPPCLPCYLHPLWCAADLARPFARQPQLAFELAHRKLWRRHGAAPDMAAHLQAETAKMIVAGKSQLWLGPQPGPLSCPVHPSQPKCAHQPTPDLPSQHLNVSAASSIPSRGCQQASADRATACAVQSPAAATGHSSTAFCGAVTFTAVAGWSGIRLGVPQGGQGAGCPGLWSRHKLRQSSLLQKLSQSPAMELASSSQQQICPWAPSARGPW